MFGRGVGTGTSRRAVFWGLRVLVAGYVAVALLGTVVTSAYVVFVLGPAAGLAVAFQVALADVGFPRRPSARRAVLWSGAGGTLLVPYLGAVVFLGSVGVVVSVVLIVLCVLVAVPAVSGSVQEAWRPYLVAPQSGDPQCDVAGMSTTRLWEEWRSAHPQLHADDPRRALSALQRRSSVLEELCRRDPTVVERWSKEGRLAPSWGGHRPVNR